MRSLKTHFLIILQDNIDFGMEEGEQDNNNCFWGQVDLTSTNEKLVVFLFA